MSYLVHGLSDLLGMATTGNGDKERFQAALNQMEQNGYSLVAVVPPKAIPANHQVVPLPEQWFVFRN